MAKPIIQAKILSHTPLMIVTLWRFPASKSNKWCIICGVRWYDWHWIFAFIQIWAWSCRPWCLWWSCQWWQLVGGFTTYCQKPCTIRVSVLNFWSTPHSPIKVVVLERQKASLGSRRKHVVIASPGNWQNLGYLRKLKSPKINSVLQCEVVDASASACTIQATFIDRYMVCVDAHYSTRFTLFQSVGHLLFGGAPPWRSKRSTPR